MGPKIQRLPRSSLLPGFMPPKPEKAAATLRASDTTSAPTRAGDWKNAAQSPRPTANAANDRPKKTRVLSTDTTTQSSRRAPVMLASLRRTSSVAGEGANRRAAQATRRVAGGQGGGQIAGGSDALIGTTPGPSPSHSMPSSAVTNTRGGRGPPRQSTHANPVPPQLAVAQQADRRRPMSGQHEPPGGRRRPATAGAAAGLVGAFAASGLLKPGSRLRAGFRGPYNHLLQPPERCQSGRLGRY